MTFAPECEAAAILIPPLRLANLHRALPLRAATPPPSFNWSQMKKTSFLLAAAALAAPALAQNDDCAGAIALAPATPTAFDTTAATVGGPAWPCATGGAPDIWFSYTTTSTDNVTVSTCNNATYDTAIEIFSGDCSNLVPVICNDDGPGCTGFTSEAVAAGLPVGTDLYIRVGGWNGSTGTGTVELTLTPDPCAALGADSFEDNDDCAGAASLSDGSYPGLTVFEADNDYFAVTVADGATLDASLTFVNANGDMDLYLWDPLVACDTNVVGQGTQTGSLAVGFSASDDEFITYTNTTGAAQNLIIEVDMFDANGCNSYDLSVTGAGVSAGPIGANYCSAAANSTGATGAMSAFGLTSVAANDVTITASNLPPAQFGIFATSQTQGFVPGAGGTSNGNLCLGGSIDRFAGPGEILQADATGEFSLSIDLTNFPNGGGVTSVLAGETRNFQAWHRDQVGQGSNFTDGIEIVFTN